MANGAASCVIFSRNGWNREYEALLSNRFLLSVDVKFKSIDLSDTSNNESWELQVIGQYPSMSGLFDYYILAPVDKDRVLMLTLTKNAVFMLKVDVDERKCSVLHEIDCGFRYDELVLDSTDSTKFALFCDVDHHEEYYTIMRRGHLADNQVVFDGNGTSLGCDVFYANLLGDTVFAFRTTFIGRTDNEMLEFCEFKLTGDSATLVNNHRCPFISRVTGDVWKHNEYVWSGCKLYISLDNNQMKDPFLIVMFDSEKRQWTRTKYSGIGRAKAMSIDADEVLTVSVSKESAGKSITKTVYRFPMK